MQKTYLILYPWSWNFMTGNAIIRFLNEMEIIPETIKPSVAQFMSYVHGSVNEMSKVYLQNERRHNYTTPKSFLELINLYVKILQGMIFKELV